MGEYSKQAEKTRRNIIDTFITLCDEKGFYNITLKELCETAGIYRSTFYRYFDNLDGVLITIESVLFDEFGRLQSRMNEQNMMQDENELRSIYKMLLDTYFNNRKILLFLLSPNGDAHFVYKYKNWVAKNLGAKLIGTMSTNRNDKLMLQFIVEGMIGSLSFILRNYEKPDDELVDLFSFLSIELPHNAFDEALSLTRHKESL